ncbi:MAG: FtsQ-type POTRA domain-containing protein [Gammaproteobacteria bacterium]|nr:FtsQ-type POTRA domain-containing protein [Gammaproteobacteria bacterium]
MNTPIAADGAHAGQRTVACRGTEQQRRFPARSLFALILIGALATAAYWIVDPGTLPIRNVRVEGEFLHLSPAALRELAKDVVRGGFFNVNVEAVRSVLMGNPWVADVIVRRDWPDALNVYVREQVAVGRWGEEGLLNGQATLFTPPEASVPAGLPRLNGPADTAGLVLDRYRYLQHALSARGLSAMELALNDRRAWSFRLVGGPSVILGRGHFVERLERFVSSVPDEFAGELNTVEVIDMRYTNGFAVRWKADRAGDTVKLQESYGQES